MSPTPSPIGAPTVSPDSLSSAPTSPDSPASIGGGADGATVDPKLAKKRAKEEKKRLSTMKKQAALEAKRKAKEIKAEEKLKVKELKGRRKSGKQPTAPESVPAPSNAPAAPTPGTGAPQPGQTDIGAPAAEGTPLAAPQPNQPAVADPPAPALTGNAAIAADLALTAGQLDEYVALWRVEGGGGETIGADRAVPLFQRSGLHPGVLETIWNIADTDEPLGELDFREFCVSLKLISLKQADIPPLPENLGKPSPTANVAQDQAHQPPVLLATASLADYVNLPELGDGGGGSCTDDSAADYESRAVMLSLMIPPDQQPNYDRLWTECANGDDQVR